MKGILKSDKRGLSEMIGYVLLIVIALSISIAVYAWIKYITPKETKTCPDDVSLVIEDYECYTVTNGETIKKLRLTISNRGLFETGGFYIRVREKGSQGLPVEKVEYDYGGLTDETNEIPIPSMPNTNFVVNVTLIDQMEIDIIEIGPFIVRNVTEGDPIVEIIACENAVIRQELENC